MRWMIIWSVVLSMVFASTVVPEREINAGGNVIDIVVQEGKIIAGTDAGTVEIYNLEDGTLIDSITFPKITGFLDEKVGAKVYSVDKINGEERYMIVLQGEGSYRHVYIVDDGKLTKIIDETSQLMIKKAKFVDRNRLLLGLMSNELVLFDIEKQQQLYRFQLSWSQFSDFQISEDKMSVASGDEAGKIYIVDVEKGTVRKTLNGGNVDNVYKVDFKGMRIATAGQDRRGIVYNVNTGSFERYDASFLIYACALSPSSKLGAWAFTEENEIVVFDLETQKELHLLHGQKSTMNTIVFIDEKRLVSGSDDKFIMIWRLP